MDGELADIERLTGLGKAERLIPLGRRILKELATTSSPELLNLARKWTLASLNCRYEIGHSKATELVGGNLERELHELENKLNPILEARAKEMIPALGEWLESMEDELTEYERLSGYDQAGALNPLGRRILRQMERAPWPELLDLAQRWTGVSARCRHEIERLKSLENVNTDLDHSLCATEDSINEILASQRRE